MVDPQHAGLSITRQCRLVSITRSSFYYASRGDSPLNLRLMRRIDEQFLETPFYGSRQMTRWLRRQGDMVSRKRVRRLMRLLGVHALFQRPRTSQPHPAHRIYPYLLRDLQITRPNHVWCTDVTYIPLQRGFLYLVAVMDWASRKVLSWRLSNTLDAHFCVEALHEALARYGPPEIFNSDQGSQFTSVDFTDVLQEAGIRISMDGKGRWMDNVFIERLWRSLKYECVYLSEFATGAQARTGIGWWMDFYDRRRPHSALDPILWTGSATRISVGRPAYAQANRNRAMAEAFHLLGYLGLHRKNVRHSPIGAVLGCTEGTVRKAIETHAPWTGELPRPWECWPAPTRTGPPPR